MAIELRVVPLKVTVVVDRININAAELVLGSIAATIAVSPKQRVVLKTIYLGSKAEVLQGSWTK